jgi:hypothetical protein
MKKNKWEIARRDLLKSLGIGAACLPLLQATRSWADPAPRRLVIIAATEGYRQSAWRPMDGPLATQTLPKSCSSLEPLKSDLIFLPDMTNPAFKGCDRCGHGAYGSVYYGQSPRAGSGEYAEPNGPTVDQVIAAKFGGARPSLNLGVQVDLPPSNGGPGHSRCFWKGAEQPINPEMDPYKTYNDMFGGGTMTGDDPATKKVLAQRKSLLDYVGKSLDRFKMRLGTEDRMAIDGHQASIRELEAQLSPMGACGGTSAPAMLDIKLNANYPKIFAAQMDLVLAALKCKVTQVATVQLADATGDSVNFAFVPGIPDKSPNNYKTPYRNWHDLAHNPTLNGVDQKQIVDQWWMDRYAEFITKMKGIQDPAGGTLLDNSVVLWGNHMHEGNDHGAQQVPWILAGKAGGYFKTGQCASSSGKPTSGVLTEICNAMGVASSPFGPPMPGLKA